MSITAKKTTGNGFMVSDDGVEHRVFCAPGATPEDAVAAYLEARASTGAQPRLISSLDVNAACDARIWSFLGVSNKIDALAKQQSFSNRMMFLNTKADHTPAELVQLGQIFQGYDYISALVEASDRLNQMRPIPPDFEDGDYWPAPPDFSG